MAVVAHNEEDVKLLARLIRAEAESEGKQGMLLVGNVGVNRAKAPCLDFRNIRTIRQMVFQNPGGFEATQKGYFYQRARQSEITLARRVVLTPRKTHCGFSSPVATVLLNGITKITQDDLNLTVSLHQLKLIVQEFTNFFLFEGGSYEKTKV